MSKSGARPLFIFGIARSGTNLVARMAGAHSRVSIALDPLLPLLRMLRNALVRNHGSEELRAVFNPDSAFHDYYHRPESPSLLRLILEGGLDLTVSSEELSNLRRQIVARAALESDNYTRCFGAITGRTYREVIVDVLRCIAETRSNGSVDFAGVKEVWTTEFVPALARDFPDALFICIERDPRDVLISLEKLSEMDPAQAAHGVSYMRHWRKHAILSRHFLRDPCLAPRLHLVKFEDLATSPERGARAICEFLGLKFEQSMVRLEKASDAVTGRVWRGNSSFEKDSARITARPVNRWRSIFSESGAACTFLCGPEMRIAGYPVAEAGHSETAVLDYILRADARPGSWRSDSADPLADFAFELLRRELLRWSDDASPAPVQLVERCFLFPWVLEALREHQADAIRTRTQVSA